MSDLHDQEGSAEMRIAKLLLRCVPLFWQEALSDHTCKEAYIVNHRHYYEGPARSIGAWHTWLALAIGLAIAAFVAYQWPHVAIYIQRFGR